MKPFDNRGRSVLLVAAVAAAAALLPSDARAPRRASSDVVIDHAPAPSVVTLPARSIGSGTEHAGRATTPNTRARTAAHARPGATDTRAAGTAGRVVALDPETGQLGAPSPEQLEQLRALRAAPGIAEVSRSQEGLVETRLTDGTVILDLDGRFQDHVVARIDRNGRLIYGCIHDDGKPVQVPRDSASTSLEEK